MTVSVLILIFVAHEFSYDRFHEHGDKIYRAEKRFSRDGRYSLYANPEFGPTIKAIDSHIVNYVRLYDGGRKVVRSDDVHLFFEERFLFADTSFFSIFSFELLKGQRQSLIRPGTVILTESVATKYFGDIDPIGKTITYDKAYSFEVVGVSKNPPTNSSLQFDFIASFSSLLSMPAERDMILNNSSGFPTYFQLTDKKDLSAVKASILKTTYTNASIEYSLSPFFENHFNLNFGDTANTRYVFIFLCVALLILALALINYMNLTTARASTRAKEVGVRKVIGARQKALSVQFYIESAVTTAISFVLALVLIESFKPIFLQVLGVQIDISFLNSPYFIGLVIVLLLICILISGSYPALVLPRFKPVEVLKGKFSEEGQGAWLRKSLTVFQFAISIGLIICTMVMDYQLNFLQSKAIGLNREQVMVVPIDPRAASSYRAIKSELIQQSGIRGVAVASIPLFKADMSGVSLVQSPVSTEKVGTKWITVDEDFLEVLDIEWDQKPETDRLAGNHLMNETAVEAFGLAGKPIGFDFSMGDNNTGVSHGKMAGVVRDFNYQTLRSRIEPLILTVISDTVSHIADNGTLYIRLEGGSRVTEHIAAIKKIYNMHFPDTPFAYYFLDDAFNELQKGEGRLTKVFAVFTSIALCIACLGLFGLITFTAERKTKEISIRKVLGATTGNILVLLSSELIVLLLIGVSVGSPLAWFVMEDWLSHFFYQVDIPISVIFMTWGAVMVLSLVIICSQGIKVTLQNPAQNLRNE